MQTLHDGVLLRHLRDTDSQGDRNDGRKTFRNGCNREGHGTKKGVFEILFNDPLDNEHDECRSSGDHRQSFAERIELTFERGLRWFRGDKHLGDLAHFGGHASAGHNNFGSATTNGGVHKHHAKAIANWRTC